MSWTAKLLLALVVFGGVAAFLGPQTLDEDIPLWKRCAAGAVMTLCVLACCVVMDMMRLRPASSHSLQSLLTQYVDRTAGRVIGTIAYSRFTSKLKNCGKAQEDTLLKILRRNASCEFGRKMGFKDITSREEFVKRLSKITTYADYSDYMDRLWNGESHLLSSEEVGYWAMTSGTTGKVKQFPYAVQSLARFKTCGRKIFKNMMRYITLSRVMELRLYVPVKRTVTGARIGCFSNFAYKRRPWALMPDCLTRIEQEYALFYVQALFFLVEKEVGVLYGTTSTILLSFFKFLQSHWKQLEQDIGAGMLDEQLEIDQDIRQELNDLLRANPQRAEEVRQAFEKGTTGLAKRLWPHLDCMILMKSASLARTAEMLDETYTAGVHQASHTHAATETVYSAILEPDMGEIDKFTPFLDHLFMEFIPEDNTAEENPATLFLDQLEEGKCYELVITTFEGLCRYRTEDVVRITGFKYSTPIYKFEYRRGEMLSCFLTHMKECVISRALSRLEAECGLKIGEYTTTESVHLDDIMDEEDSMAPFYVFFIELDETSATKRLSSTHETKLDSFIAEQHEMYDNRRKVDGIAMPNIIQVATGTFVGLKSFLTGGRPNPQFKMPRVLRKKGALQFLAEHAMADMPKATDRKLSVIAIQESIRRRSSLMPSAREREVIQKRSDVHRRSSILDFCILPDPD